jgi:penicillin-binding protein 1A
MERGTDSRSERERRENGRDSETASAGLGDPEAPTAAGNGGAESVPESGNGEDNGGSLGTVRGRGALTGRIDREIPAPPRTQTGDGNGDGGNGKPPGDLPPLPPAPPSMPGPAAKPRLKKLRLLLVVFGLGLLALVSTVFGMMAAVSQDLPAVYDFAQYKDARNSRIFDDQGSLIGTLTSNENKILLDSGQISQNIKNATVSIEDSRFYQHSGVDFHGIARALVEDVLARSAKQGASTITEQFVKNALTAQSSRTVFEKFREAATAYQLEKHWSKDKILTEYLNTIYYGEGAYGIESAARTYFGKAHPGCGTDAEPCASVLLPQEAAMLAGIISSPSAYDPKLHPVAAKERRDEVLSKMHDQGYITDEQYTQGVRSALPARSDIVPPQIDSKAPYFTTWLRQQLVDKYGAGRAFFGGLKVKSTLDLGFQQAAEDAVYEHTAGVGLTGSVVAIDNKTGAVKAMVGGPGFDQSEFNVATQGARQPGSSFKPFTLVSALELGHSPYEVFSSAPKVFHFGKHGQELFKVNNFEDNYLGSASIITATTYSDNSVYADLGLHLKKTPEESTRYIAQTAHKMGITTPVSTNPAMVLGGLKEGVNTLEMAHAYETLAEGGQRISGTLAPKPGIDPVAYTKVTTKDGHTIADNDSIKDRVMPQSVADTSKSILQTVIADGTGTHAQGASSYEWGKTGTTENYGDAWFCGATADTTMCVWVGHLDSTQSMSTEYGGSPVEGGTIPADIWRQVMGEWETLRAQQAANAKSKKHGGGDTTVPSTSSSGSSTYTPPAPSTSSGTSSGGSTGGGGGAAGGGGATGNTAPATPAPTPAAPAAPAPSGGGSTGAGGVAPG